MQKSTGGKEEKANFNQEMRSPSNIMALQIKMLP